MKFVMMIFITLIFFNFAQANEKKYQLTQATYVGISKVQKLLDENKNEEAKTVLLELEKSSDIRKKLDKAYVRFYIGYFYTLVKQNQEALKYFKEAISYKSLAPDQVANAYLNIIQILMESEKYKKSLFYIDELIKITAEPKSKYYVTKANIEMILEKYKNVIVDIDMAIKVDKKPKPSWLKIKYYSFYMLKDYKNAISILKELIVIDPKNKKYWMQLSSLYSVTDDFENSLASLDISNIINLDLSEKELLRLVSWLQYNNTPHKAAVIMEEKINSKVISSSEEHLNSLGDLYYEARSYDKAIYWYKNSAKSNKSATTYFKIAKIYANQRKYADVVENINLSLDVGGHKDNGLMYLILGKAYYDVSNNIDAKKSFYKAKEYEQSRKMAEAWLNYL